MSIYCTLWEIRLPASQPDALHLKPDGTADALHNGVWEPWQERWVEVFAQAVPPHIGHAQDYPDGDPYAEFLPPPVADYDGDYRAVVIVQAGREAKEGQRYVDPLMVLTGAGYRAMAFGELLERIAKAVR